MLDPKRLRTELETVAAQLKRRGLDLDVARIGALEERRKTLQVETQELQNARNTRSKAIGKAKAAGEDIQPLLEEVARLGDRLKAGEVELATLQAELEAIVLGIPNLPHPSVPDGSERQDMVERVRHVIGKLPDGQRQVITLVDLAGFSYAEIADTLDRGQDPAGIRGIALRSPEGRFNFGAHGRNFEQHEDHREYDQEGVRQYIFQVVQDVRDQPHSPARVDHIANILHRIHAVDMVSDETQKTCNDNIETRLVCRQRRCEVGDRTSEYGPNHRQYQHDGDNDNHRGQDTWHTPPLHPYHRTHSYEGKKRRDEKWHEQRLAHLQAVNNDYDGRKRDNRTALLCVWFTHAADDRTRICKPHPAG